MTAKNMDQLEIEISLIERCRKQDVEAFGKFVDLYNARVYGYLRRLLSDNEEAQDLTQEVFIRAYQAFPRFDSRASVKTWLFRIAHNLCIDRARKVGRRPEEVGMPSYSDQEEADVVDHSMRPDDLLMNQELTEVVENCLNQMSEKLRSVILFHDREDLQYDEIASILGVPVGTVKSRLFLARAALQKALQAYLNDADEIKGGTF